MQTVTQLGMIPSQPGVCVSVCNTITGQYQLSVYRVYEGVRNRLGGFGLSKPLDHDGKVFNDADEAFAFALDRGYLQPLYERGPLAPRHYHADEDEQDYESSGPDDLSDDAWVLASAGMGTDEDYGYYGDSDY